MKFLKVVRFDGMPWDINPDTIAYYGTAEVLTDPENSKSKKKKITIITLKISANNESGPIFFEVKETPAAIRKALSTL